MVSVVVVGSSHPASSYLSAGYTGKEWISRVGYPFPAPAGGPRLLVTYGLSLRAPQPLPGIWEERETLTR